MQLRLFRLGSRYDFETTSLVVLLHRDSPRMGKLSLKTYAVSTHACAGKLIDVSNVVNKSEVEAE